MKFIRKTGTAILFLTGVALACMGPTNIQGVALNSGEEINFNRIEELGTDGIAYLKDVEGKKVTYRYKSNHPNVMVFLTSDSSGFAGYDLLNSLGIKVDSTLYRQLEAGNFGSDIFSFTEQLHEELKRMKELKIITFPDAKIDEFIEALTPVMNGGAQYWTTQKEVTDFNSWFNKDGTPSEPIDGVAKAGPSNEPGDGCGSSLSYDLPFGQLGSGPTSISAQSGTVMKQSFTTSKTASGFSLNLSSAVQNSGELKLFTTSGRQLMHQSISAGTSEVSVSLPETARGIYLMKLSIDGVMTNLTLNR